MSYLDFYKAINLQKQIDKFAKKYKDKKIVIYSAGSMTRIVFDNFDLSKLNIVAVCDKTYEANSEGKFYGFKTISPDELADFDFDVLLVNMKVYKILINHLKFSTLVNTKNQDIIIKPLFYVPNFMYIKYLFL